MADQPDIDAVRDYLLDLQDHLCRVLAAEDGGADFQEDTWTRPAGAGTPFF